MPVKALPKSAAKPTGPVTCTFKPSAPGLASAIVWRKASTALFIRFVSFASRSLSCSESRLIGKSAAVPSSFGITGITACSRSSSMARSPGIWLSGRSWARLRSHSSWGSLSSLPSSAVATISAGITAESLNSLAASLARVDSAVLGKNIA